MHDLLCAYLKACLGWELQSPSWPGIVLRQPSGPLKSGSDWEPRQYMDERAGHRVTSRADSTCPRTSRASQRSAVRPIEGSAEEEQLLERCNGDADLPADAHTPITTRHGASAGRRAAVEHSFLEEVWAHSGFSSEAPQAALGCHQHGLSCPVVFVWP